MDLKAAASSMLGVSYDDVEYFEAFDKFNNNEITGYLCRKRDHRYGALIVITVNGHMSVNGPTYCTPKLKYPFGRNEKGDRIPNWPKEIVDVRVYDKLDGTAVCCYRYLDHLGNTFVTFKTRLSPVLGENSFGDYYGMWCEILERYPELRSPREVASGEYTFTYELYGYRNPILIKYPVDLDARLLFAVLQDWPFDGLVQIPEKFKQRPLEAVAKADSNESTEVLYESLRVMAEQQNVENSDGSITGREGFIFYVMAKGHLGYRQYKCKPEGIETVHWENAFIPYYAILTTVWNSLEDVAELNRIRVVELLHEDFTAEQIACSTDRLDRALDFVSKRLKWRSKVDAAYKKLPITMDAGRTAVMKKLSEEFPRDRMRDVYNALRELGHAK